MFKLDTLKSPYGSTHHKKRKGKGMGTGNGKTAGKGHKGQKARSGGGSKLVPGFEGGQTALARRMPKVGFKSRLKRQKILINLSELPKFEGQDVKLESLLPSYYKNKTRAHVSIMGCKIPEQLPKSIEAHRLSPFAKKALEEKGVQVTLLDYKNGKLGVKRTKKSS